MLLEEIITLSIKNHLIQNKLTEDGVGSFTEGRA